MYRNKPVLKAVALAIYVKEHTCSSLIKDWSVNKIHSLTKMSATTIKKRLATLKELGLVKEEGKHLVFLNMKSHCKRNNQDISHFKYTKVSDIEHCLQAILVVLIQQQKNYANLQLQHATNGKTSKEVKQGQRERKLYGWQHSYIEHGLSYKGIAKKLGVCVKTAFEIVKYCQRMGFLKKVTHIFKFFAKGCQNLVEIPVGYTFMTKKGYLYKVFANTYELCSF